MLVTLPSLSVALMPMSVTGSSTLNTTVNTKMSAPSSLMSSALSFSSVKRTCRRPIRVMQYYKVYLQKETDGSEVKETIDAFGIYCAEMPFTLAQKAKDITTRDWNDEQGIDAYVPQTLMLKDYDMNVKFCCKGDKFTSNAKIKGSPEKTCG